MPQKLIIEPLDRAGSYRQGGLTQKLDEYEIQAALGFAPNIREDDEIVKHSWGFEAQIEEDGKIATYTCGIWDYNGCRWSTYGPCWIFDQLFPGKVTA